METLFIKHIGRRKKPKPVPTHSPEQICQEILKFIEDRKGVDSVTIPLKGKSALAEYLIIASAGSQRQISSMAEDLSQLLKRNHGIITTIEGLPQCDWVLIDAGDIIVHLFRPEVRTFYNLEKMWGISFEDNQQVDAHY